ncbi:unnamed protein product, partial [Rotaria sp. Silwood1]
NQSTKPIDGICASARWSLSGVTVAGGKGSGSDLDQLYLSDGLFVDANSTVYAVDSGNNRIVKWISGAASEDRLSDSIVIALPCMFPAVV